MAAILGAESVLPPGGALDRRDAVAHKLRVLAGGLLSRGRRFGEKRQSFFLFLIYKI